MSRRQSSSATANVIRFPTPGRAPERLLTLAELQDRLGYSKRWWQMRIAKGMPRRKWAGGHNRFDFAEVVAWLDEHGRG